MCRDKCFCVLVQVKLVELNAKFPHHFVNDHVGNLELSIDEPSWA